MFKALARQRHLRHLSRRLMDRPLAIEPNAGRIVLTALAERLGLDKHAFGSDWEDDADTTNPEQDMEARCYEVVNGVAIVPIVGELCHRSGAVDAMSGLTSYGTIVASVKKAVEDSTVRALLLDIDSPGGEISGLFDALDDLKALKGKKPIWAFSNERCFSAAYAIACFADKMIVSRTAGMGSIGVICFHQDRTEAYRMEGVRITPIHAGKLKAEGADFQRLTPEAKGRMQKEVDAAYHHFLSAVATNRSLDYEDVRATEAGCFYGIDAVSNGLADAVMSFGDALRTLATEDGLNTETPNTMTGDGSMGLFGKRKARKAEETKDEELLGLEDDTVIEDEEDLEDDAALEDEEGLDEIEDSELDEEELAALEEEDEDLEAAEGDEDEEEIHPPAMKKGKKKAVRRAADEDEIEKVAARRASKSANSMSAARAAGIVKVCTAGGCPEVAERLIRRGASVADARKQVALQGAIQKTIKTAAKIDPSLDAREQRKVLRASQGSLNACRKLLFDRLAAASDSLTISGHIASGNSGFADKQMSATRDKIMAARKAAQAKQAKR